MNNHSTATEPSSVWPPPETRLRPGSTGSSASTAFATEWALEQTAGTAGSTSGAPVFVVVGFDGSEPAQRALDAAARLLRDRDGRLEVVYVAHVPAGPTPSAGSMAEVSNRTETWGAGWPTKSAPGSNRRRPAGTLNAGAERSPVS